MPGIQEWVHKFEEGAGARYIKLGALLLAIFALAAIYDVRQYHGFAAPEAMDSAQLARNIAAGKGFTTGFIRPLSLHLLEKQRTPGAPSILREPHPDIANPPVYPLILAGLMKIFPFHYNIGREVIFSQSQYQPELIIALFNQALFFLAAFLTYVIGRRLFDRGVGLLAAALLLTNDLFWNFSVSGLSTLLLVNLLLALIGVLLGLEQNQREGKRTAPWFFSMGIAAGALIALGTLTRYAFGWFIIPALAYVSISLGPRRWIVSAAMFFAFAAVVTPWLVRNERLSGHPFGVATFAAYEGTVLFQGNRLERLANDDFESDLDRVQLGDFERKLVVNGGQILRRDVMALGGGWLSAFFFVGLLMPFQNPGLGRMRLFLLLSLFVFWVAQALGRTFLSDLVPDVNSENLLALLAPPIFIFGAAMFFVLLDQTYFPLPQLRALAVLAFGLVVSIPLLLTLLPPHPLRFAYPPYLPPGIQDVSEYLDTNELMMSDMPWAVAWWGDRQCLWVTMGAPGPWRNPLSEKLDFFRINDQEKRIAALYLTTLTTDAKFFTQIEAGKDYEWGKFMVDALARTNIPAGFPLVWTPPGFLENGQLFLTDRPRWQFPPRMPAGPQ